MDISAYKIHLENMLQPAPLHALVSAEQAWAYLKTSIREPLDEDFCDEFGFSMSLASHYDGNKSVVDENLFQIYFGRLIDPAKGRAWRTAEINFYYRYPMNAQLRALLAELPQQDFEVAYCTTEEEAVIRQKIDSVFAFADQKQSIWDAVRELQPTLASYHFWSL
jgi:hypothetical protein